MSAIQSVRPSPIAGTWYPADPQQLTHEITRYLDQAEPMPLAGRLMGIISPHAGYFYSGATAGGAYQSVRGMHFDLCVVASPLHAYTPHPLLVSAHAAYATPLGKVEVDQNLVEKLNQSLENAAIAATHPISNDREHSLEIQLPFLQVALQGSFQLLPLMVRSLEFEFINKVAIHLAELIRDRKVLLVASSDLSHFYDEDTANILDERMLRHITDFSAEDVLQAELNEESFACGAGAIALVLATAKALGANRVSLLHHSTSANASGDVDRVVGYGALAITRQEGS